MAKRGKYPGLTAYLILFLSMILAGCAAPTSGTGPGRGLALEQDYKYKIVEIDVSQAPQKEVDVKGMLRDSLEKALREKNLLWDGSANTKYYGIAARIIEYEMGNAFKRWLMPTYGSTVLSVHTDVIDLEKNQTVTFMEHKQTVAVGGGYTIGAWKSIFNSVAKDIAVDLERKYSGSGQGFSIELDPWLEKETDAPEVVEAKSVNLQTFQDMRTEKFRIGERTAAFNVSMGDIYTNRDAAVYFQEALQNELLASGNSLSDDNSEMTIRGELLKFWVHTDTTALYWDIVGEVDLRLTATNAKTGKTVDRTYNASAKSRTYVYPTRELLGKVIADTVRSLMYEIRREGIWNTL